VVEPKTPVVEASANSEFSLAEEHLAKAEYLRAQGSRLAAELELSVARTLDHQIPSSPRYQALADQLTRERADVAAGRAPMRVGAVILIADALVNIFLALRWFGPSVTVDVPIHATVNVYLAVSLFDLNRKARRLTMGWVIFALIASVLIKIPGHIVWAMLLPSLALCASIFMLFLGQPSRLRTGAAALVYSLGALAGLLIIPVRVIIPVGVIM
jgi:hypothetical protein